MSEPIIRLSCLALPTYRHTKDIFEPRIYFFKSHFERSQNWANFFWFRFSSRFVAIEDLPAWVFPPRKCPSKVFFLFFFFLFHDCCLVFKAFLFSKTQLSNWEKKIFFWRLGLKLFALLKINLGQIIFSILFCCNTLPLTSTRWFGQHIKAFPRSKKCRWLMSATSRNKQWSNDSDILRCQHLKYSPTKIAC